MSCLVYTNIFVNSHRKIQCVTNTYRGPLTLLTFFIYFIFLSQILKLQFCKTMIIHLCVMGCVREERRIPGSSKQSSIDPRTQGTGEDTWTQHSRPDKEVTHRLELKYMG